ncbi:TPA: restriction endonuclease subunit S [Streptococcus suis]
MMKMKDSDVEWIGKIPENWEMRRLKYTLKERKEKNDPIITNFILSLSMERGVFPYSEKIGGGNKAKEDLKAYKVAYPNDIVLNSMNILSGSVGLSKWLGAVSPVYYTYYSDNKDINMNYYHYLFHSKEFQRSLLGLGNGILMKESNNGKLNTIRMRIPSEKLNRLLFPVPPKSEQLAIAYFLDENVAKIDAIIADTKLSIEELKAYKQSLITEAVTKGLDTNAKMKDSGVEWIGVVPEGWKITRIKYNYYLKGRIGWQGLTSADYIEEGPYLITGTDLVDGKVNWNNAVHISTENYEIAPDIHLKDNDLLISKDGTIGKVALVSNIGDKQASLNSGVLLVRNTGDTMINRYLFYVLQSNIFWRWFDSKKSPNSTILHLYQGDFKDFKYPVPDYDEQGKIAKYLDINVRKIDKLLLDKNDVITQLEIYKKSLIYEYVTGKKQVM